MKQSEFKHRHPDGMNYTVYEFKKNLYKLVTSEEYDRIIKHAKKRKEKRELREFRDAYISASMGEWCRIPMISVMSAIKNPKIFSEVLMLMFLADERLYNGEDEEPDNE